MVWLDGKYSPTSNLAQREGGCGYAHQRNEGGRGDPGCVLEGGRWVVPISGGKVGV